MNRENLERSTRHIRRAGERLRGLLERSHRRRRWESETAAGYTIYDLDQDEVLRTGRLQSGSPRLPESSAAEIHDGLERLGLGRKNRLSNAAVVRFGTRLAPEFTQCQLHMARFRGKDKSEFLARRQIVGHAFQLLDEAMRFLRRHLPVAGRVQPGLFEPQDEPLFPVAALREALVNAICHRDYGRPDGAVRLAIYGDRLEIWSDGALPVGVVPEDLRREHRPRLRNPLIADVFYRRGLIERWGRGTEKIVELCVRAGHREPEFGETRCGLGSFSAERVFGREDRRALCSGRTSRTGIRRNVRCGLGSFSAERVFGASSRGVRPDRAPAISLAGAVNCGQARFPRDPRTLAHPVAGPDTSRRPHPFEAARPHRVGRARKGCHLDAAKDVNALFVSK